MDPLILTTEYHNHTILEQGIPCPPSCPSFVDPIQTAMYELYQDFDVLVSSCRGQIPAEVENKMYGILHRWTEIRRIISERKP